MKILFLAPQPFYEDRGTPIAVDLLLRALSERGDTVEVVTYHEGRPRVYKNVVVNRIAAVPFIKNIRPGFSWKKIACDILLMGKAFRLCLQNKYDLVHAVEESAFIALLLKIFFRLPYVYDMDSSMAAQVLQKYPFLKPVAGLLSKMEALAAKHALAVIPVCPALATLARGYGAKEIVPLPDISLLSCGPQAQNGNLRTEHTVKGLLFLYVGNLEPYQGIDLMLEAFQIARAQGLDATLAVIGGQDVHLKQYRTRAAQLGIADRVVFTGPKPPEFLGSYLEQADVLLSPRTQGTNTPMKIYSYLHSGKPVLATRLETHTQVMTEDSALLKDPTVEAMAAGMLDLGRNAELRRRTGAAGRALVEQKHTYEQFKKQVDGLYQLIEAA
jgi:glycosyltransferase involved in cell wall biosynthesis